MAGGAGVWGELIKQGFQNFRNGLNTLNSGYGNIAQAANSGKQQFTPMGNGNNAQVPTNTDYSGIFTQGMADKFRNAFKNDEEEENNDLEMGLGTIGTEARNQAPSLFDRIRGF